MFSRLSNLFDTSDFVARWNCGNWSTLHGWAHILSDIAIFGAYAAIPLTIAYFISRKRDVTYPRLYWLFAAFIFFCGFTHLVEAMIFWQPFYRLSGVLKLSTAVVSWAAVFALIRYLPEALRLPGIVKLNQQLESEIRERREAEDEVLRLNADLRNRVDELETLLHVLPVGIGITNDPEARSIRTNPAFARILRLSPEANASLTAGEKERPRHFKSFRNGREIPPDQLPIQRAARTGEEIADYEQDVVFDDGTRLHLLGYAAPLRSANRSVRGAVGAFVDITTLKAAEESRLMLEQSMQETQKLESLGILAGGIAHDFNNLLTAIVGNASLLRMKLPPGCPMIESVSQIEDASQSAADLCKQMLAYAGKGRFELRAVHINKLVQDTTMLLQASIHKSAQLRLELSPEELFVKADPSQIQQIVMNLVINASEALGGKPGEITIQTAATEITESEASEAESVDRLPAGKYIRIQVTDSGCGMDKETLAHIFEPFYTTKFTGRGLGLAAVLGIVRRHHGELEVTSEKGRGTRFRVVIPACEREEETQHPEEPDAPWHGRGRLLIIDDEQTIRDVTERMAETIGYTPLSASSGVEGMELYREYRAEISAVLLDMTMPCIGGEETFRQLRCFDSEACVLLMSGYNEQETVNRFVGKGLAGFLQKPFGLETLRRKLQNLEAQKMTSPPLVQG